MMSKPLLLTSQSRGGKRISEFMMLINKQTLNIHNRTLKGKAAWVANEGWTLWKEGRD